MSHEKRTVPLWKRLTESGHVRQQRAGVVARTDGSADAPTATWYVSAASLGGLTPRAGDTCRGTDGIERRCVEVKELAEGEWACVLERIDG